MDKAEEGNGHVKLRGCLLPLSNKLCVGKVNDPLQHSSQD